MNTLTVPQVNAIAAQFGYEVRFNPTATSTKRYSILKDGTVVSVHRNLQAASEAIAALEPPAPVEQVIPFGIRPVKKGTKRVEMMKDLLAGTTIKALATKYNLTYSNASGFPTIARTFGYDVIKVDGLWKLILPEGMTDLYIA